MNTTLRMSVAIVIALTLVACNRQGPEIPKPVGDGSGQDGGDGVQTVVVDPNGAFVGAAVGAAGEITTPQRAFNAGDTVYVSVPSKGRRLGSPVEVFWFHDDGKSRKDEQKRIAGSFTVFEFQPTDPGQYNVEVDVGGRAIALVDFLVKQDAP